MDYDYAHRTLSGPERVTVTGQFNKMKLPSGLEELRQSALERAIPVSDRETLTFLITLLSALKPKKILELGTAVGVSAAAMLSASPQAEILTVEKNENFAAEAIENFKKLNISPHIKLIVGDAGEVIDELGEKFDFIFLDSAKVQYVKYLPRLKQLLTDGGTLIADDVLMFGYVAGETPVPPKRKMLVEHIKEYISAAISDPELLTTVLDIGNGICMSVKRQSNEM